MVSPKSYTGFDSNGKAIAHRTGVDATTQLNPADVKREIDNFNQLVEEKIKIIKQALLNLCTDADVAMIIEGTKTSSIIEDLANALDPIPGAMTEGFADLYDTALKNHDILQENNNIEAYNALVRTSNVVSVKQGYYS